MSRSFGLTDCPICREPFEVAGPGGVMVHLVALHPYTDEAQWVVGQVSRLDDRDPDAPRARAGEPVG